MSPPHLARPPLAAAGPGTTFFVRFILLSETIPLPGERAQTREGFAMTSHTEAWIQGQLDGYAMRVFNPRGYDETEYRLGYEEGRKRICG